MTAALASWLMACPLGETADLAVDSGQPGDTNAVILLPQSIPDPLERFNRGVWALNEGLLVWVVQPTARGYRFVVRKPVRTGISNFGRNIRYPGRLINNLLQARWTGARDETYRFFLNTVVGIGGIFDPASRWGIPRSDADFGQTFGKWGWQAGIYLMVPVIGPSNERDALGLAVDTAANPLAYWSPYPSSSRSLTLENPYTYYGYAVMYNDLSDRVDEYVRLISTQKDPYAELHYVWGFARKRGVVDFEVSGPPDRATLETLQSAFASFENPEFPRRGKTESALIYTTGYRLKFSYWLQPWAAPIVYIVPGLGSHRLTGSALGLAEMLHAQGFSVAVISNPFNYEFLEQASTAPLPGYTTIDAQDLHVALTAIDQRIEKLHPGRLGARALLGYSMGAFEVIALEAAGLDKISDLMTFDRIIAINTPVRLLYGVSKLDEFMQAPLAWPASERQDRIENTFLKIAAMTQGSFSPEHSLPFSAIESKFLIGSAFRLNLRDVIFATQQRHDQGVLKQPIDSFTRQELYREITQYSFQDYFTKFVIPGYENRGIAGDLREALTAAGDLRMFSQALKNDPKFRVISNRNDFLLSESDLEWLEATFSPERLTLFETGGHLGNLLDEGMREAILRGLEDLRGSAAPVTTPVAAP